MNRSKAILISLDGLGDRPVKALNGLTPLEAAARPHLNRLAREGVLGLVDPYAPGYPCGTDTGHLCLLGYDAYKVYSGRGPIEALGAGLDMAAGDVAFRCNFATVDDTGVVIDRRAGRIREGTGELGRAITNIDLGEGISAHFSPATEHRGVLVLRGSGLSAAVSDSDPGGKHEGEPVKRVRPLDESPAAARTALALQKYLDIVRMRLKNHPVNLARQGRGLARANVILTRGAGVLRSITPLSAQYPGLRGAVISGEDTVLAVGRMAGCDAFTGKGMTGSFDFDPAVKAQTALRLLPEYDLILLHVKATDLAGHDGQPGLKQQMIERIDLMVGQLLQNLPGDTLVAVTADHSTPCEVGEHSGDPVPALIWGLGVRTDVQETFGERTCAMGGLGRLTGNQFFHTLLDLMGFMKKFGA